MTLNILKLLLFPCLALVSFNHLSAQEEQRIKIAKVNFEQIHRTFSNDFFHFLTAGNGVKKEVAKLIQKREKLLAEVLRQDDSETLKKLKADHQALEEKLATIHVMIAESNNYSFTHAILGRHIIDTFSKEFQIILDMRYIDNESYGFTVDPDLNIEDITTRAIKGLEKLIP